eukprot:12148824-Ditylum_brightwellii.AAC.1
MDACSRIGAPGEAKMVLISGYSGVGKSSIVEHVKRKLNERKIHFISGKFDQLQQATPLSAIDAAFNEYTNSVIQQGPQTTLEIQHAIIDIIDSDIGVLTE